MSTTMSSRPFRPAGQDMGVAVQQPSATRKAAEHAPGGTITRSQQLARALQSAEEQMASPQFRPDSTWTEADADVIWQGKRLNEVPSPMMRSPALQNVQQEQQGEFADADEGSDSEEMHSASADDNTTFTTLSTSGSSGRKSSANTSFQSPSAFALPSARGASTGAPLRPQRKAPRPPVSPVVHADQDMSHEYDPDDDGPFGREDAQSQYGHVRDSSVGSSIFAGRGAKPKATGAHLAQRPPVPAVPNALKSPFLDDNIPAYPKERRDSVAETNSVYSQGGATPDWNDNRGPSDAPTLASKAEKGETSTDRDGEFEMMDTQSIYEGRTTNPPSSSSEQMQGQRRLPDGTVIPKMPPVPLEYQGAQSEPKQARSRAQRGRKNRSPVLSYADGEEEERRLVQESELREHGGMEVLTSSSSLGPRLKKNSPAPWEMDEDAESLSPPDSLSAGMPNSRPSIDNLLSASSIKNPTQWARQSMETFRNRSTSSGHAVNTSTSAQTTSSSSSSSAKWSSNAFPTSSSQHGLSPLANGDPNSTFARSPLSGGDHQADVSQGASSTDEAAPVRRARTKSVSGSAAVMLKGLGLATSSSSNAPTKKSSSSHLAKAFRSSSKSASNSSNTGNATNDSSSSSRNKQAPLNLSRGISSDDYAHLPPSPQVNNGGATLSVGGHSPYLTHSSANSHASLSPRSDAGLGASADSNLRTSPSPSPFLSSNPHVPQMPVRKASAGMTAAASPVSTNPGVTQSSIDGHSFGGSSNSHNASSTGPTRGVDSIDQIIEATNNKFANQSLTPGTQLRNLTPSSFGTNASSVDTTAESFSSPATSVTKPATAVSSSQGEFNSSQLKNGPVLQTKASPATSSFATGSAANGFPGTAGANSLDTGRSSGGSGGHRSQDSQPFADAADRTRTMNPSQPAPHPAGARSSDDQMQSVPVMRMPGVGAHEGVPYKLISLEQARQQQQQLNRQQPKQRDDAHGDTHSLASEKASHGDSSSSLSEKTLKGKKSGGFLRRFGKEKGEMSMNSSGSDGFGPLPSFGPSIQLQHAQQKEAADPQNNVAPTLSVRPMSSMFNGLSVVGLLDDSMTSSGKTEQAPTATDQPSTGQLTPSSANFGSRGPVRSGASAGGLSPRSPAFTVKSVESGVSAGEYYDAMERASPMDSTLTLKKQTHLSPQDPTIAGGHRNLSASPAVSSRRSTDSLRSDTSSALGLVSGFPALPATGHGATAASLTSKARTSGNGDLASLASATRQRALEIEAKLNELHLELHKLRSFAVESGLARNATVVDTNGQAQAVSSPKPAQSSAGIAGVEADADPNTASMPTTPAMTTSSGAGGSATDDDVATGGHLESLPQSPTTPNIQTPIPPCVQCGCSCLEEKRLQSLNELAILKGISVLDRGRALKPLAGQNGSKFGGYLDR